MDTNILLENGTNELEVLEFQLGTNHYGINVAKIREILSYMPVTPIPNAHPCIEGIFMPRDSMITVINLRSSLGLEPMEGEGLFIITNFNSLNVAFHVDAVCGIHRVSWGDIIRPDNTINGEDYGISTGVIKLEGRLVVILDFEKIVTDISPETGLKMSVLEDIGANTMRADTPILIVEDSLLLSKLITNCLKDAGYTQQILTTNGQEAWDTIQTLYGEGTLDEKIHCVITDIEMPIMDGHHLTKLIKEDENLKHLPVVIFSSLVNDEMRRKGEALGADAQLTKPEIGMLVESIDQLMEKYHAQRAAK